MIGEFIKMKREEKELTQKKLGEMIGACQMWASNVETGKTEPNFFFIDCALEALDSSLAEFEAWRRVELMKRSYKAGKPFMSDEEYDKACLKLEQIRGGRRESKNSVGRKNN